ncbi:MAG TPA: metalloregulator ArsR/SmtB family transcription factor [Candidatus Saccharimonadales bacterium]|nr:metalloregulator ArsR/SmtB family transcription factor [Candidatus Saccharimonadales bacterium]
MDAAFQAIAEPNRRRILQILAESDELSSGEIAAHFRQTPAAVSQHLGVLEQARLVAIRREGARRLYRLREEGFRELREFIEGFWEQGLARLKSAAEARPVRPERRGRKPGKPRPHAARAQRRRRA